MLPPRGEIDFKTGLLGQEDLKFKGKRDTGLWRKIRQFCGIPNTYGRIKAGVGACELKIEGYT